MLYLDSSAVVKLVSPEPESPDLVDVIREDPGLVASELAWTEVVCAVRRARGSLERAEAVLEGLALVPIDGGIIRAAAELGPPNLRTLDAIHLATALSVGDDLTRLISYDDRLIRAAAAAGIEVASPGSVPL
jgi:uncharacterized protein